MQTCIMSSLPHCIFRCSVFRYVTLVSFVFLFKLCYLIVTLLLWWRINTYLLTYLYQYLLQPGEEHDDQWHRASDRIWSKASYRLRKITENPGNRVMYYLLDGPE